MPTGVFIRTEKYRKKMSQVKKGVSVKSPSKETREKISKNNARFWLGKKRPNLHSNETRKIMSEKRKGKNLGNTWGFKKGHKMSVGRIVSEETKQKIREKRKLQVMRKGFIISEESKQKMRLAKLGRKQTKEHIEKTQKSLKFWRENPLNFEKIKLGHQKTADALRGKPQPWNQGSNSHLWKGGLTSIKDALRKCYKYVQWRKFVFYRDDYTCQSCGDNKGGNLEPHHIKAFSLIFYENKIETYEQGLGCEELWDIKNGITMCNKCHENTPNFGRRDYHNMVVAQQK